MGQLRSLIKVLRAANFSDFHRSINEFLENLSSSIDLAATLTLQSPTAPRLPGFTNKDLKMDRFREPVLSPLYFIIPCAIMLLLLLLCYCYRLVPHISFKQAKPKLSMTEDVEISYTIGDVQHIPRQLSTSTLPKLDNGKYALPLISMTRQASIDTMGSSSLNGSGILVTTSTAVVVSGQPPEYSQDCARTP